ncbi:hypothetical protein CTI14_66105, partial [Methylobacterium radiotolerans]
MVIPVILAEVITIVRTVRAVLTAGCISRGTAPAAGVYFPGVARVTDDERRLLFMVIPVILAEVITIVRTVRAVLTAGCISR